MKLPNRLLDYVFIGFFLFHIPMTLFLNSQYFFPASFYPSFILEFTEKYIKATQDPFAIDKPLWFRSIMAVEVFIDLPFFFVAIYALLKGKI